MSKKTFKSWEDFNYSQEMIMIQQKLFGNNRGSLGIIDLIQSQFQTFQPCEPTQCSLLYNCFLICENENVNAYLMTCCLLYLGSNCRNLSLTHSLILSQTTSYSLPGRLPYWTFFHVPAFLSGGDQKSTGFINTVYKSRKAC